MAVWLVCICRKPNNNTWLGESTWGRVPLWSSPLNMHEEVSIRFSFSSEHLEVPDPDITDIDLARPSAQERSFLRASVRNRASHRPTLSEYGTFENVVFQSDDLGPDHVAETTFTNQSGWVIWNHFRFLISRAVHFIFELMFSYLSYSVRFDMDNCPLCEIVWIICLLVSD